MTGYSKTPLIRKLGIKPGFQIALLNAPDDYLDTLGALPDGVTILSGLRDSLDLVQFFTRDRAELDEQFPVLKQAIKTGGALWISWPKRASRIPTDLDENVIREIGLKHGLVDVKVCAVDEVWSGLKFVYRLEDRT
jgi:hypothetical protein